MSLDTNISSCGRHQPWYTSFHEHLKPETISHSGCALRSMQFYSQKTYGNKAFLAENLGAANVDLYARISLRLLGLNTRLVMQSPLILVVAFTKAAWG